MKPPARIIVFLPAATALASLPWNFSLGLACVGGGKGLAK